MDTPSDDSIRNQPFIPKLQLTLEQENDIKMAFDLLDTSGTGLVDADNFGIVASALGYEMTRDELKIRLEELNSDLSKKLSLNDFTVLFMRKIAGRDSEEDIIKSFALFDLNNMGVISFENIQDIAKILGEDLTHEEITEMIDEIDDKGDGVITLDQFKRMMKKSVILHTP